MTRTLLRSLAGIVGEPHVLTGDATAGYAVDWTGRFRGQTPVVVRPRDTAEVAAVLALCTDAGLPVVPQGGNTGLVGGGVPLHGEVVLSLTRLNQLGPVDHEAAQVTAGAGVTLRQVADADPGLDLGILIASRDSATVGGAVATNAGGLRVLRFGPMRAQLRGIEAVLADGTVVSHLAGLVKDNTGYDYPSLLAGSEGTLAVITAGQAPARAPAAGHGDRAGRGRRPGRAARAGPPGGPGGAGSRIGRVLHPGRPGHPGGARRARAAAADSGGGVSAARGVWARCVRQPGGRDRRPGGRRRGVRGRPRPALVLPGTPPGGGRVPRRPGQARRLGTRRAVGAARLLGGGRGGRRGSRALGSLRSGTSPTGTCT